jgi:hypothetical protein
MAMFNLNDYETVEERLKRFYTDHPDGRVVTENLTTMQDRQVSTWVVKAEIYLPIWGLGAALERTPIEFKQGYERDCWFLKATGHAFEVDGGGGANKTSALENAETSAIGRALANAGYSGNKRASREEMEKVSRETTPSPARNWQVQIDALKDREAALQLFNEARTQKAGQKVLDAIEAKGKEITGKK